jgi:hypothetical protein
MEPRIGDLFRETAQEHLPQIRIVCGRQRAQNMPRALSEVARKRLKAISRRAFTE